LLAKESQTGKKGQPWSRPAWKRLSCLKRATPPFSPIGLTSSVHLFSAFLRSAWNPFGTAIELHRSSSRVKQGAFLNGKPTSFLLFSASLSKVHWTFFTSSGKLPGLQGLSRTHQTLSLSSIHVTNAR
jgi:hypothetical protein